ncbi:hypothetical protein K7432_014363 [Basidiobolus ranarum]|uniref:Uncharacterized protein n=1 Tax=Basidiobolus ranarum TaxID=34480 RepID=A0ABR2WHQ8_9FUNG
MVHYTSCQVPSKSQVLVTAQCEVPFGTITLNEEWTKVVVSVVSVAQPMLVTIVGLTLWRLWWLNRRWSFKRRRYYGPGWAIATSMTHMPGLMTLLGSLSKIRKFGVKRVTFTLTLMLLLVGVILPLLSLLWSSFVIKIGQVPYKLENNINVNLDNPPLPEVIKSRSSLLMSMGKIVYGEKPLLSNDLLKDHMVGMSTAEITPVRSTWRWWRVEILPHANSCMISVATTLSSQPTIVSSVNYGNSSSDIIVEEVSSKCSTLRNTLNFFKSPEVISDSSPIPFGTVEMLRSDQNQDSWCHVQYSCRVKVHITRGEILTNSNGEVTWNTLLNSNDPDNIYDMMVSVGGAAKIGDFTMRDWLDAKSDVHWQLKAVNLTKEAANIKYAMYVSLGKYKSAHETLQQTLREFTREATLRQPQVAVLKINGTISKIQFSWIAALVWLIAMAISAGIWMISSKKVKSDPLLNKVLDSSEVVNRVAMISEETKISPLSDEQTYYGWPLYLTGDKNSTTASWRPKSAHVKQDF